MQLRDYQEELLTKICESDSKRNCIQLATGGGKTIIFQELIKRLKGRTLVLCHRRELIEQTKTEADIMMAQTFTRRKIDPNNYDNLIIDECHRGEFRKTAKKFKGKLYGFSATPMVYWTETFFRCLNCGKEDVVFDNCCGRKMKKIMERIPLSSIYGKLIQGISIKELIKRGFLVEDLCYELPNSILDKLKFDSKGNETSDSAKIVFGNKKALQNTVDTYKKICLNKKTLIFNSNTIINKLLHEKFLENGFKNVRRIDSKGGNKRKEAIEWFKKTPNAILLNVHILTTGFDCTDVQSIILNRATKSLPLFLQIVGRGGRITNKIYKPTFDVVDLGGNIRNFGRWAKDRDWEELYTYTYEKTTGEGVLATRQCHSCEFIMPAVTLTCPCCGEVKKFTSGSYAIPTLNGKKPLPNIKNIIRYCKDNNLEMVDARKIVYQYFADMFIDVSYATFYTNYKNGILFERLRKVLIPIYFEIQKSDLKGNKYRTLNAFINETIKKILKNYD